MTLSQYSQWFMEILAGENSKKTKPIAGLRPEILTASAGIVKNLAHI
jgi:hypothetical protein